MLTVMRDRAGMTLEAGLPVSIVVTEIVEGSKCVGALVEHMGRKPMREVGRSAGIGFSALCR
jgi:hypothetical protein